MEFIICNKAQAPYILPEKPYVRLSFVSPTVEMPRIKENDYFISSIVLRFDDADVEGPSILLFNNQHAERIIRLMESVKNFAKVVVINCEAGISRSAGAAAALSYIYNGSDVSIIRQKPLYNRHVYSTIIGAFHKILKKKLDNLVDASYGNEYEQYVN